jgi:hypothetical protein
VPATIGTDSRFRAFGECLASLGWRLEELAGLNPKTSAEMENDGVLQQSCAGFLSIENDETNQ